MAKESTGSTGWSGWTSDGGKESYNEKDTSYSDGSHKSERLDSINGDRDNHQHTWTNYDSDGKVTSAGATPYKHHESGDRDRWKTDHDKESGSDK